MTGEDGVWVVFRKISTPSGDLVSPMVCVDSRGEAERLKTELSVELGQRLNHPAAKAVIEALGIQGVGFFGSKVPRQSLIQVAPANSPVIVGKA